MCSLERVDEFGWMAYDDETFLATRPKKLEHQATRTYGAAKHHSRLTLAVAVNELSDTHSALVVPNERPTATHSTGGLVGPKARLDAVRTETTECP